MIFYLFSTSSLASVCIFCKLFLLMCAYMFCECVFLFFLFLCWHDLFHHEKGKGLWTLVERMNTKKRDEDSKFVYIVYIIAHVQLLKNSKMLLLMLMSSFVTRETFIFCLLHNLNIYISNIQYYSLIPRVNILLFHAHINI